MEQLAEAFREFEKEENEAKSHIRLIKAARDLAASPRVSYNSQRHDYLVPIKGEVARTLYAATIDAEIKATEDRIGAMREELKKAVIATAKEINR